MWSPTHVQVTGTNDIFVTIALGKEKYQTSVKEKATGSVEWHEECELQIPEHGNTAQVVLTALHRNFMGVDEFLALNLMKLTLLGGSLLSIGSADKRKSLKRFAKSIGNKVTRKDKKSESFKEENLECYNPPLSGMPVRSRSGQLPGEADPGVISEGESEDDEFTFDDLSHKSSASSLSATQPPATNAPITAAANATATLQPASSLENLAGGEFLRRTSATPSAMQITKPPAKPPRTATVPEKSVDEWEEKLFGKQGKDSRALAGDTLKRRSWEGSRSNQSNQSDGKEVPESPTLINEEENVELAKLPDSPEPVTKVKEIHLTTNKGDDHEVEKEKDHNKLFTRKLKNLRRDAKFSELFPDSKPAVASLVSASAPYERIIIGGESEAPRISSSNMSQELMQKFQGKSREELVELVCELQGVVEHQKRRMKDMEDYLDNLLLRVMETTPRLLQNPYVTHKTISSSG
ncbi:hypothetical protein B566_EDAN002646 [Ephemera danica]|nr:hypothetical protein B566_EDAN002646 [Ephemera danica]